MYSNIAKLVFTGVGGLMSEGQIPMSLILQWAKTDAEKWERLVESVFWHETLGPLPLKEVELPYLTMIEESEDAIWNINGLDGFFLFVTPGANIKQELSLFVEQLESGDISSFEDQGEGNVEKLRQAGATEKDGSIRIFKADEWEKSGKIVSLGDYHPWKWHKAGGGNWDNYDKISRRIIDLKNNDEKAIDFFSTILDELIAPNISLAYVPSHDSTKKTSGIRRLVQKLANRKARKDATGCIVRTQTIPKLSHGGKRDIGVQLNSLKIVSPEKIYGCALLIIDDVTTTGNSLSACRRLFFEAGAAQVRVMALGETV